MYKPLHALQLRLQLACSIGVEPTIVMVPDADIL